MLDLLKNPDVLKLLAAASTLGGILGYLFKRLAPYLTRALSTEHDLAEKALARALKTPDPKDDEAAQKKLEWVERMQALIDEAKK